MRDRARSTTSQRVETGPGRPHAQAHGLLGLQRQAGNAAVAGLLGSVTVQRQDAGTRDAKTIAEHRRVLGPIQAHRMSDLLSDLANLPPEVRTDTDAGMEAGGPRLVLAMHAVAAMGTPWQDFIKAHNAEIEAFSRQFEDQVLVMVAYLGGPSDYVADKQLPQWPEKFAAGDGPAGLPQAMRARVTRLALENRAALPVWGDLAQQPSGGYKYIGDPKAFKSGAVPPLEQLVRKEILAEGGPTAVNTYDNNRPPLTLGAGFLKENAVKWISTWLSRDENARLQFRKVGVDISGGTIRTMQADGTVVEGTPAMAVFAASPQLLSLFMTAGEDPRSQPMVLDAQLEWIRANHINAAAREAEKRKWPEAAIAVCVHINHWLPAFGWGVNKDAYLSTGGNMLAIVRTFGRLAGVAQPNGAIIVGNGPTVTTPFSGSHFDQFGSGAGQAGVAKTAAEAAGTPVTLSLAEIASAKENAGFLFFRLGEQVTETDQKVGWLRLPAK